MEPTRTESTELKSLNVNLFLVALITTKISFFQLLYGNDCTDILFLHKVTVNRKPLL